MGPDSVTRSTAVLRAALNWGHLQEYISTTPHKAVKRAKGVKGKTNARNKFTMRQCAKVVKNAPESLQPILSCMFFCGCRPVGARRLQVKDVDLSAKKVWFTSLKGDTNEEYSSYYTTISGDALKFFKAQVKGRDPEEFVFTTKNDLQWSERNLAKAFGRYRDAAELNAGWDTMYVFRHSVITHMIKQGMPAAQVAEEYGTSLEYISKNYYERDDKLARKYSAGLTL